MADATSYVDGLYTGTARGIGGRVDVAAIIEGGVLADLVLTRLKETSGIGQEAGPVVAANIVAAGGTAGVDVMSGATVTSTAVIDAADMALLAAVGGYNDGSYEGTARGIGGRVDVRASFVGGELANFELTRLKETSGIGQETGPVVAANILATGTYEGVDAMAGATVTSSAVLTAAQAAFEAASGAKFLEDYQASLA